MSFEVNFFETGLNFQARNSTIHWIWPLGARNGVQSSQLVAVSLFPAFNGQQLTVTQTAYEKDRNGDCNYHFLATAGDSDVFFVAKGGAVPPVPPNP
jgi:hypothetical protein